MPARPRGFPSGRSSRSDARRRGPAAARCRYSRARGVFRNVAYVDVNSAGDLMKFAETVANNRGVPMTVFNTVAEAEQWLAGKPR